MGISWMWKFLIPRTLTFMIIKSHTYTHSSQPSYKLVAHLIVWGFSFTCGAVLAALTINRDIGEAGILDDNLGSLTCMHMLKHHEAISPN